MSAYKGYPRQMDSKISYINSYKLMSEKKNQTQMKHVWGLKLTYLYTFVVLSDSCNETIWTLGSIFCTIWLYKI